MSDPQVRLHALVSGRVQGVGYRAFVMDCAVLLELSGWVRNTNSGQVEVVAEGTRPALERLVEFLQRGPRMAAVEEVRTEWSEPSGEFPSFGVRGWF